MIAKLHYISQEPHVENIEAACKAGVQWVQLRVKSKDPSEIEAIALKAQEICSQYDAKLIINDHVEIAKKIQASGVHLGKKDISPEEAGKQLNPEQIIGGTANTIEDIERLSPFVDYIGLGPFRYTSTKKELSPILGIEGLKKILEQCQIKGIDVPIVTIGGIGLNDIADILDTGIHGVAVASLINSGSNKEKIVKELNEKLTKWVC